VLANLLSNAVKFTERGEVVLRASWAEDAGEEVLLRVEVRDTGIGVPANLQARIFDAFAQGDESTTRRHGGTGLGLAIAKQLVEMMGGEIGVKSEPGEGSTFWFTARLKRGHASVRVQREPVETLKGLRVLIVDGHGVHQQSLLHYASAWGIQADSAVSGAQALELLDTGRAQDRPYDIVILDRDMVGMDALALARAIKADPSLAAPRLVLLTSLEASEDTDQAQQAGIQAYLTKPVRQSRLYDCLLTLIRSEVQSARPAVKHSDRPRHNGRLGLRVLLAEDNPVNQEVALGMLESLGCQVDVAANGREAVEVLSRRDYQLVFMDCQMPEMDGFEATRAIREQEAANTLAMGDGAMGDGRAPLRLPIIALTAHAMAGDREQCLEAGMDDYLSKPFTQGQLREVLERWAPQPAAEVLQAQDVWSTTTVASPPVAPNGTLDRHALDAIRGLQHEGAPDLLERVITTYLKDAPRLLQTMVDSLQRRDAAGLRLAAHSLKSSSASLGAIHLAAGCKVIELRARTNDLAGVEAQVADLAREFQAVARALEAER
jgi:CheY-like chemotaxis protein